MEQQEQQARQKTAPEQERKHSGGDRQQLRPVGAWAAQAILNGAPIRDLSHQSLRELAERIGNSGMLALAAMGTPALQTRQTDLTGPEPRTQAFAVPQTDCRLAPVQDLTCGSWPSGAFDPGGLA